MTAAAELLDAGGQEAVTLRAVAERVGVSHNAPYKHFRDRRALLAGVAQNDFANLDRLFNNVLEAGSGRASLRAALGYFVSYALDHPSRYRLLFSDPTLPDTPELKASAIAPFSTFMQIVSRCQEGGDLPRGDPVRLAGLIYASVHGAIDLQIGGRASGEKGLGSVNDTVDHLLDILAGASACN